MGRGRETVLDGLGSGVESGLGPLRDFVGEEFGEDLWNQFESAFVVLIGKAASGEDGVDPDCVLGKECRLGGSEGLMEVGEEEAGGLDGFWTTGGGDTGGQLRVPIEVTGSQGLSEGTNGGLELQ